jgi:hypothetical protein
MYKGKFPIKVIPPNDRTAGLVVWAQICGTEGPGSQSAQDKNLWIVVVFH